MREKGDEVRFSKLGVDSRLAKGLDSRKTRNIQANAPSAISIHYYEVGEREVARNWDSVLQHAEGGDPHLRLLSRVNSQIRQEGIIGNYPGPGFEAAWSAFTRAIEKDSRNIESRGNIVTITKDFEQSLDPIPGLILGEGMREFCLAPRTKTVSDKKPDKRFIRPLKITDAQRIAGRYLNRTTPLPPDSLLQEEARIVTLLSTKGGWRSAEVQAQADEFYHRAIHGNSVQVPDEVKEKSLRRLLADVESAKEDQFPDILRRAHDLGVQVTEGMVVPTRIRVVGIETRHPAIGWLTQEEPAPKLRTRPTVAPGQIHLPYALGREKLAAASRILRRVSGSRLPGAVIASANKIIANQVAEPTSQQEFELRLQSMLDHFHVCFATGQPAVLVPATGVEVYQQLAHSWSKTVVGKFLKLREHIANILHRVPQGLVVLFDGPAYKYTSFEEAWRDLDMLAKMSVNQHTYREATMPANADPEVWADLSHTHQGKHYQLTSLGQMVSRLARPLSDMQGGGIYRCPVPTWKRTDEEVAYMHRQLELVRAEKEKQTHAQKLHTARKMAQSHIVEEERLLLAGEPILPRIEYEYVAGRLGMRPVQPAGPLPITQFAHREVPHPTRDQLTSHGEITEGDDVAPDSEETTETNTSQTTQTTVTLPVSNRKRRAAVIAAISSTVMLLIIAVFKVVRALNGNHGEWTNTDDVPTPVYAANGRCWLRDPEADPMIADSLIKTDAGEHVPMLRVLKVSGQSVWARHPCSSDAAVEFRMPRTAAIVFERCLDVTRTVFLTPMLHHWSNNEPISWDLANNRPRTTHQSCIAAQLNGSNGEATNSDDVPNDVDVPECAKAQYQMLIASALLNSEELMGNVYFPGHRETHGIFDTLTEYHKRRTRGSGEAGTPQQLIYRWFKDLEASVLSTAMSTAVRLYLDSRKTPPAAKVLIAHVRFQRVGRVLGEEYSTPTGPLRCLTEDVMREALTKTPYPNNGNYHPEEDWDYMVSMLPPTLRSGYTRPNKPANPAEGHARREAERAARADEAAEAKKPPHKGPLGPAPEKPLIRVSPEPEAAEPVPAAAAAHVPSSSDDSTASSETSEPSDSDSESGSDSDDTHSSSTDASYFPSEDSCSTSSDDKLAAYTTARFSKEKKARDFRRKRRAAISNKLGEVGHRDPVVVPWPTPPAAVKEESSDESSDDLIPEPIYVPEGWVLRGEGAFDHPAIGLWEEIASRTKKTHILYNYECVMPDAAAEYAEEDHRDVPARRTTMLKNTRNGLVYVRRTAYKCHVGWMFPGSSTARISVHVDKALTFERPGMQRRSETGFMWHNVELFEAVVFPLDCESARHVLTHAHSIFSTVRVRSSAQDLLNAFALAATPYYDRTLNMCRADRRSSVSPQDRLHALTMCYHVVAVAQLEATPRRSLNCATSIVNWIGQKLAPYKLCSSIEEVRQFPVEGLERDKPVYHFGPNERLLKVLEKENARRRLMEISHALWAQRLRSTQASLYRESQERVRHAIEIAEWFERATMIEFLYKDGLMTVCRATFQGTATAAPSAPPDPPRDDPPPDDEDSGSSSGSVQCADGVEDESLPVPPGTPYEPLPDLLDGASPCAAFPETVVEGKSITISGKAPAPTYACPPNSDGTYECGTRPQPSGYSEPIFGVSAPAGYSRAPPWPSLADVGWAAADIGLTASLSHFAPTAATTMTYLLYLLDWCPDSFTPMEKTQLRGYLRGVRGAMSLAVWAYQIARGWRDNPDDLGSSSQTLNGLQGEWTGTDGVESNSRLIYGYIYGDVFNRNILKECSPSLLYELKPKFWEDYVERKPVAVLGELSLEQYGTGKPFMVPTYPDQHAGENHLSALIQRVGCVFPTPDPTIMNDYKAYDRALRELVFSPYSPRVGFGEWLSKMQKNAKHGQCLRTLYDQRFSTYQMGEDPQSGIYEYSAFIKHEGWAADKPKIARAIQAPDPMFKCHTSSWVKSFDNALYASLAQWNVKSLTSSQVAEKLIGTFNEGEGVFATDYTAFEGHHHGAFAELDWEWMRLSLVAVGAPDDVVGMLHEAMLGNNYGHFPTLRFVVHQRLMSGAAWTSSMNLRLNFSLCSYLVARTLHPTLDHHALAMWVHHHFRGLFEGDDGIFRTYGLSAHQLEPLIRGLGLQLKIETHRNYNSAMFCSLVVVRSPALVLIPDPVRLIRKMFCVPMSHSATTKLILGYQRSVALSYKYSYPDAPIIGSICDWMIAYTHGYANLCNANPYAIGMACASTDLMPDGTFRRDVMRALIVEAKPTTAMRLAVEENFGVPLSTQLELERAAHHAMRSGSPRMLCPSGMYGLQSPADAEYVSTYVGSYPRESPKPPGWHLVTAGASELPRCKKTHFRITPFTD